MSKTETETKRERNKERKKQGEKDTKRLNLNSETHRLQNWAVAYLVCVCVVYLDEQGTGTEESSCAGELRSTFDTTTPTYPAT